MSQPNTLKRSLNKRQLIMFSLGGAIGTGLFLGSGLAIATTGPSILLGYACGGVIMYIILRALGSMVVYEPNVGSFSYYAHKYINPFMGFICGWNYWFLYIIICMLELTASSIFINYWLPNLAHWISSLIILIIFGVINMLQVKLFGEFEFWFASIKVTAIVLLIIFGIYLISTAQPSSMIHVSNLWAYGGFFPYGIHGFILSFVAIIFAFGGAELIGITAGEAQNPEQIVPLAINGTIIRILIFYIGIIAILMILQPWNKINDNISPFVDIFTRIGVPQVASIMNIVILTAALSAFNAGTYTNGRVLYNLSLTGHAPKSLNVLNTHGVPFRATVISLFVVLIVVCLNYIYPHTLFSFLLILASTAAMLNWTFILITHMFFHKKVDNKHIQYRLPFYPLSTIVGLVCLCIVLITIFNIPSMRSIIYILPLWLCILTIAYHIKKRFYQ